MPMRGPGLGALLSVLCFSIFTAAACTPPNKEGGASTSGPATDWKEGYGGDSLAIEIVRHIEKICFRTRAMRIGILSSSLATQKDLAKEVCGLLEPNALIVEPLDQPMVKGIAKDAVNYPNARPRRLEVKRSYWASTASDIDKRDGLILHEILPLIGLEDADYVRSTRMLVALQAGINQVTIASCDEKRIEAIYSAGNIDFLKLYTKNLGASRCEYAIDVLQKHVAADNFESELKFDLGHYYLWGVFTELARAKTAPDREKISTLMRKAILRLPGAFNQWSQDTCHWVAEVPDTSPKSCGNFFNVIAGASARLKYLTAESDREADAYSFERATIQVFEMVYMADKSELFNNPLLVNKQVAPSIVRSAIEGQNWRTLFFLGDLQRRLNPDFRPSEALLTEMNFRSVQANAPTSYVKDGMYSPLVVPLKSCLPEEIRVHSALILDGTVVSRLRCGTNGSI